MTLEGCTLWVGVKDGEITSLTTNVTPTCPINREDFGWWDSDPSAKKEITFGDIEKFLGWGTFQAHCLQNCGNLFPPSLYMTTSPARSNHYLYTQVSTYIGAEKAEPAVGAWAQMIVLQKGEDYLHHTKFNCDGGLFDDRVRPILNDTP